MLALFNMLKKTDKNISKFVILWYNILESSTAIPDKTGRHKKE